MISGAQPWYWQAQEDPVAAAQSAEVEAALVFAEQENHRAAQGQRLLKQTEEELRRICSKLVDLRGMLSVSETARKWAQAEFSISEERRAIQVCSLDAEVILHREDAELQRQRAESSERLRHRLETGISYVVGAIAGVTMPVSSIERKRFDVRDDLETGVCVDAVCAPLTSRVPGREDPIFFASNKYCQPVLGSLRRELANARAAARAALRHLHMARATSAAATHRADIAEMRIELAFDRVEAAESAGLAMAAEIAQLKLQSSFVAVSASDAASAGFAASEAAHSCALARAVESEHAHETSDAAFTAAMMANQKAMGMIVSMQRGNASDIAVAAAAQSVCAARTAIALSRSGVAAAAAASSEQAGDDLRAHETTRAKARIRLAEQDVATLAVLSGAHTSVAQEAVFYSVLNIRRAAAAEFAFEALRSSHERAITDAQASRAQLADFQNRSLGSLIAARKSIHDAGISLVEELRALEGLMILRLFGWHEMLVRTQKKLLCVEGHARRHHALMNRRLSAASEALVVAENDAASLHRLKDTGPSLPSPQLR